MSLTGILNIGSSALAVQQASLQVTGNNISNAGNPNYTRQVAQVSPASDTQVRPGIFVGNGINLTAVQRQIDEALESRLRSSNSDASAADTTSQWMSRVESVFNALGDQDLSSQLSAFFNSWSSLAGNPSDTSLRESVLSSGQTLATGFQNIRSQLGQLQQDADTQLQAMAGDADSLAQQIADLNKQILTAEAGSGGQANGLRDQRDAALSQLSQLMDISTNTDPNGVVNVYVGSEPLVLGSQSRGVALQQQAVNGQLTNTLTFKTTGGTIPVQGGQIGALNSIRTKDLQGTIDQVDDLAGSLIFELNKIHASGHGTQGFDSVTATNAVDDPNAVLNSATAGLQFPPSNGSFIVEIRNKSTGNVVSASQLSVRLDGGASDDTLESLRQKLDDIDGISASVVDGKLTVSADNSDTQISFREDSSNVLASLGINSFFTGTNASTIAVNQALQDNPALLAAARTDPSGQTQNGTALSIADLATKSLPSLQGVSLQDRYEAIVNGVAVSVSDAKNNSEAAQMVQQTLTAQRESLSGVSLDEEAVNLIRQQRAYQAAARLISAVDEMMKTVLQLV